MTEPTHQSASLSAEQLLLLGEIKGLVSSLREDHQRLEDRLADQLGATEGRLGDRIDATKKSVTDLDIRLSGRIDVVDARLRTVEQRSAAYGALAGSATSIGILLLVESLKAFIKRGGN